MAYQTGTVSSFSDLKSEILAFLSTNGWTQEGSSIIKKNGVYASLTADTGYIEMIGAKGSDGGGNLVDIFDRIEDDYLIDNPGCRIVKDIRCTTGGDTVSMNFPVTYHFHLADSPVDTFWCFLEYNGGYSQHLGLGNIVKACPFTGGGFYTATCGAQAGYSADYRDLSATRITRAGIPEVVLIPFLEAASAAGHDNFAGSALHAEIAGVNWWFSTYLKCDRGIYEPLPFEWHIRSQVMSEERNRAQSPINGIASLIPFRLFGTLPSGNLVRLGHLENIRFTRIDNITFGQVEDDGTDKWKFYPVLYKNSDDPDHSSGTHSGTYGLAVRYDGP